MLGVGLVFVLFGLFVYLYFVDLLSCLHFLFLFSFYLQFLSFSFPFSLQWCTMNMDFHVT